ncbi:MAG TPA: hypothetical protein PKD64_16610 [Pirellulaceae bacterium]|nr:hypothetical protein [Pirellulaceae bacterium]HMO93813.1 hypothetical protein [Pirellulaceae bacterium]
MTVFCLFWPCCVVGQERSSELAKPNVDLVIKALNEIENQFSGKYVEIKFGEPSIVGIGLVTYQVWNPTDGRRRRLEKTVVLSDRLHINHYCQLSTRNHYVTVFWSVVPEGVSAGFNSQKPIMRVHDASRHPFLLIEHVVLIEQRCGLDAIKLSKVIQANRKSISVKKPDGGEEWEWSLRCDSSKYGVYTIGFDVVADKAVIRQIDVLKSSGNEILDGTSGVEVKLETLGDANAQMYAGFESVSFTIKDLVYDANGLKGWSQSQAMKPINGQVLKGSDIDVPAVVSVCEPLSEPLSDLIEFKSFHESEIQLVTVSSNERIVHGIKEGKLVRLKDRRAEVVAQSRRMGEPIDRTWWYVSMGLGLIAISGYLIWRKVSYSN